MDIQLERLKQTARPLVVNLSILLGVSVEGVYGRGRSKEYLWIRYIVWTLLRNHFTLSMLGQLFGRGHSTVINGIAKLDSLVNCYSDAQLAYEEAKKWPIGTDSAVEFVAMDAVSSITLMIGEERVHLSREDVKTLIKTQGLHDGAKH